VDVFYDLNIIIKGEGVLKVIGNHVCWKSASVSETVLDRDVAIMHWQTTNRKCHIQPI